MSDEQDLIKLATTDPVTGLHNHPYFLQEAERTLRRAIRSQQPLSILFLNLDGLSEANVRPAAALLRKSVRVTDFAARREGSDFELLLPETNGAGAELVAEKLRAALAGTAPGSMAVGIATFPENGGDTAVLFVRANEALTAARAPGSSGIVRSKFAATVKIPAWIQRRFSAGQGESPGPRHSGRKTIEDSTWTKTKFETGDKPLVSNEWTVVFGGWRLDGEEWVSENEGNNILIWNLPVSGSFRYACEGWNEGAGEISILGRAYEGEQSAHWGYAFHVGADGNSCAKFTRLGSTAVALPGCTVEPQRRYRLEIDFDDLDGVVHCYLDGKRIFEYHELLPFSGNQIGLYAWGPGAHLKPLEVRAQKTHLSAMELADDFFELKDFKTAHQCYEEIAVRVHGTLQALQAKLKAALCLAQMDRLPQARREFAALKGTALEPFALGHEGMLYFQNRNQLNSRNGVEQFEELLRRFPASHASQLIVAVVGHVRDRTRRFGATRANDLKIRARMNRLARDSFTPPSYAQIRSAIELARIHWQSGEWKEALDETLQFQAKLLQVQYDVADFRLTSYVTALSANRDDLLGADPSVVQPWEVSWYPDWCTGIVFHNVVRKGNPEQFIEQYHATVAEYPSLAQSLDLKHAVMLLHLASSRVPEAAESLRALLPGLKEDDYVWLYWVGGALVESRQDSLFDEFTARLAVIAQREGRRSNVARALSILTARRALEGGDLRTAAQALEEWPSPDLSFHFSEGLVLQALLSSLNLLSSPSKAELEESIDARLGGAELQLAEIFLRNKDPRPDSHFPHPTWRPEFRLWLALWLEAKGDRAGARSVAEPALDRRYGMTHSQPALKALLDRK